MVEQTVKDSHGRFSGEGERLPCVHLCLQKGRLIEAADVCHGFGVAANRAVEKCGEITVHRAPTWSR